MDLMATQESATKDAGVMVMEEAGVVSMAKASALGV